MGWPCGPTDGRWCVGAQLSPERAEEYIEYLKSSDRLDEAAQRLATVVNDERFVSKAGKSNYQVGPGVLAGREGQPLGAEADFPSPRSCGMSCVTSSPRTPTRCSLSMWTPSSAGASPASPTSWASSGAHWPTTISVAVTSRRCLGRQGSGSGAGPPSSTQPLGTPVDVHMGRKPVPVYC